MMSNMSQTKVDKMNTQSSKLKQSYTNYAEQTYINPIIKHTFDSLPRIYGYNTNRKKKYNLSVKRKFYLNTLSLNPNEKACRKHECWHSREINTQKQEQPQQLRQRGHTCLQFTKKRDEYSNEREYIPKTTLKKRKNPRISTEQSHNKQSVRFRESQSVKGRKFMNLPRQKCNRQYCSCKSLYDEYQEQINKKTGQKSQINTTRKSINTTRKSINTTRKSINTTRKSKIQLPRLPLEIKRNYPSKLDDRQSMKKVKFNHQRDSYLKQSQQQNPCCYLCRKSKQIDDGLQSKGLLGLIKKKEFQQKATRQKRSPYKTQTNTIGVQIDPLLEDNWTEASSTPYNENFMAQAKLVKSVKKGQKIDQSINTAFQQDSKFKYLQNNRTKLQQSLGVSHAQKKIKKQPLEHLSHLKEKHKLKKRPTYQSKYSTDQHENENQGDQSNSLQTQSVVQRGKVSKTKRGKKQDQSDLQEQFEINISTQSVLSQNQIANHLVNALSSGNAAHRSTIFKMLKKRQILQSENQAVRSQSRDRRRAKTKRQRNSTKFVDEQNGLFIIPEQDQYVDYLKNYKPIMEDFKIKNVIKSDNFRILKYKDTLYFGQIEGDDTKFGKALFISPKQIFQGVYQNGVKISGCQRNIDGVYVGQFVEGKRHGKGKFTWNNGQTFEGQWKFGTKNGLGTWKSPKGDYYQGEWLLNRQHGKGVFKHKNSIYEGQFKLFLKDGFGKQKFINGDQYIGQYSSGKPHGRGKYTWKNGTYYKGDFNAGLRQGYGYWYQIDDQLYEGQFKSDFKHGKGKETYRNGDCYQGQFIQGIKTEGIYKEGASGKQTQIKTRQSNKASSFHNLKSTVKKHATKYDQSQQYQQ